MIFFKLKTLKWRKSQQPVYFPLNQVLGSWDPSFGIWYFGCFRTNLVPRATSQQLATLFDFTDGRVTKERHQNHNKASKGTGFEFGFRTRKRFSWRQRVKFLLARECSLYTPYQRNLDVITWSVAHGEVLKPFSTTSTFLSREPF